MYPLPARLCEACSRNTKNLPMIHRHLQPPTIQIMQPRHIKGTANFPHSHPMFHTVLSWVMNMESSSLCNLLYQTVSSEIDGQLPCKPVIRCSPWSQGTSHYNHQNFQYLDHSILTPSNYLCYFDIFYTTL